MAKHSRNSHQWNTIKRSRHREAQDLKLLVLRIVDAVLLTLPIIIVWYAFYGNRIALPFFRRGNILILAFYFMQINLIGRVYDAFEFVMQQASELLYSKVITLLVCNGLFYVVISLLSRALVTPIPLFLALVFQMMLGVLFAYGAQRWYFRAYPAEPTAILYTREQGLEHLIGAYGLTRKFDVQLRLTMREALADLSRLDAMRVVFFTGSDAGERAKVLTYCIEHGLTFISLPRVSDVIMSGARTRHMFHLPMLVVGRYMASPEYRFMKRLLDILVSLVALILLSPILLITALLIKLDDGGPILYSQERLTKNRAVFRIWKFRSMRTDAEADNVARLSSGDDDPRITKVGHFIRKTRIDELPQLFCILFGTMSLCGPRPERPEIAEQYEKTFPEFALRLQTKAGLTGFAQIYGKYNTSPYDKLLMDLMYIAHPSILADVKLLIATFKVLFMSESTEGVDAGQITALGEEQQK